MHHEPSLLLPRIAVSVSSLPLPPPPPNSHPISILKRLNLCRSSVVVPRNLWLGAWTFVASAFSVSMQAPHDATPMETGVVVASYPCSFVPLLSHVNHVMPSVSLRNPSPIQPYSAG